MKTPELTLQAKATLDNILQQLYFCRLKVTFEAVEAVELPVYKGSTFRGCLGEAYRHEACRLPGQRCESCRHQYTCAFAQLFETPIPAQHHLHGKFTRPPRPYLIVPMPGKQTLFEPGSEFWFELTLIGKAIKTIPLLLSVFVRVGMLGIGTGRGKCRPVRLEQLVPGEGYGPLPAFATPHSIRLADAGFPAPGNSLTLRFEHPLRILSGGKPYRDIPPFTLLAGNIARRVALLGHLYCDSPWAETELLFGDGLPVEVQSQALLWKDWKRYSGTHDMDMYFDGHTGQITYAGELAPWAALLAAGQWLHAGSTATFGLGKYSIV